jgi:hypothetical protein
MSASDSYHPSSPSSCGFEPSQLDQIEQEEREMAGTWKCKYAKIEEEDINIWSHASRTPCASAVKAKEGLKE